MLNYPVYALSRVWIFPCMKNIPVYEKYVKLSRVCTFPCMKFPVYEKYSIHGNRKKIRLLLRENGILSRVCTFPCMNFPVYEKHSHVSSVTISRVRIFPCMTNIQVTSLHGNQTIIPVITREFSADPDAPKGYSRSAQNPKHRGAMLHHPMRKDFCKAENTEMEGLWGKKVLEKIKRFSLSRQLEDKGFGSRSHYKIKRKNGKFDKCTV